MVVGRTQVPRESGVVQMIHNEEELLELYHSLTGDRMKDQELSKKYGIGVAAMDYFRIICGKVEFKQSTIKESVRSKVVRLYKEGKSLKDIRKEVYGDENRQGSIYHILRTSGIELERHNSYSKIQYMRCIDMRERQKMTYPQIGQYFGIDKNSAFSLYQTAKRKYGKA